MAGFENGVLVCDNVNFNLSGPKPHNGIVTSDGQLLIGATVAPNIRAGTLGSSDSSITWTVGAGTITGQVTGGTTVGKTITGDAGGSLSPSGGNWNIIGGTGVTTSGTGSTLTINSSGIPTIGSSTDNALVRWDGAGGTAVQNGVTTEDDTGNISQSTAVSGGNLSILTANTSNTASATAFHEVQVAGATASDAYFKADISGGQNWTFGLDNSDSDAFALSSNATLGTTNVMRVATTGEINYPLQPAFLARSSIHSDVTGDGTAYTIIFDSEQFDQNSDYDNTTGVFTAPVAGRYFFTTSIYIGGIGASHTELYVQFVGNGVEVVRINPSAISVAGNFSITGSAVVNMAASATCTVLLTVTGGTKTVDVNAGPPYNSFGGYLIC